MLGPGEGAGGGGMIGLVLGFGGLGMDGPPVVNDRGCREQTRRASTSALRNNAQKSCAPTSLEPLSSVAAFLKSDFSYVASASSGNLYYVAVRTDT